MLAACGREVRERRTDVAEWREHAQKNAPERTVGIPKSPLRGHRRAGSHNSLTRTRINPVQLAGGYAQFTYGFNYWGPIGVFTSDSYAIVRKLDQEGVISIKGGGSDEYVS